MKVLLIGGTGVISTDVALLASGMKGIDLYLLNRGKTTSFLPDGVSILKADICDAKAVKAQIKGMYFDVVCDFITYGLDLLNSNLDIFRGCCGQYCFVSSVAAYRESRHLVMTESNTSVGNVLWSYGRDKAMCERRLKEEFQESGMRYTIIRPAYTYNNIRIMNPYSISHWESWTIAHRMLEGKPMVLQDDGLQLCTVTHTEDFARAFVGLLGNPAAMNEDFHITSDEYITWKRIAEIQSEVLGTDIEFCYVPAQELYFELGHSSGEKVAFTAKHGVFDSAKVRRTVPGFSCRIPFAEGVRRTFAFYAGNPEYRKVSREWDAAFDRITERFYPDNCKNGKI